MKNKLLILALAAMPLVFVGCGNANNTPNSQLQSERQVVITGVLQSLGGAYNSSEATHLLRLEDGTTVFLKSEVLNLEDTKFKSKMVEIAGYYLDQVDNKEFVNVVTIDLIETDDEKDEDELEIAEWIDFDSANLGLSFKYRNDYELDNSNRNEIALFKENEADEEGVEEFEPSIISFKIHPESMNLIEFLELPGDSLADLQAREMSKSKVGVNSSDSIKYLEGNEIHYYLETDKGVLLVSFIPGENEDLIRSEQNMFYDILASLKVNGLKANAEDDLGETDEDNDSPNYGLEENDSKETNDVVESDIGADENEAIETASADVQGFESFKSSGLNFEILYPKSYYFAGSGGKYQFSSKPLEESDAINIVLETGVSNIPSGQSVKSNASGMEIVKVKEGSTVTYYVKGKKSYKLSGSSSEDAKMLTMAQSLKD